MLVDVAVFIIAIILFLYYRRTRTWNKYKLRGIKQAEPTWPLGSQHAWSLLLGDLSQSEQYRAFLGTDLEEEKIFGIYGHPDAGDALIVNDLEIAKGMLVKDFDHFVDRTDLGVKFDPNNEGDMIFSHSFIFEKGDDWKRDRSLMTPAFTTGKLKQMFKILAKCGDQLETYVDKMSKSNEEINAKDLFSKFALDGIATAGFGIETNSFKDPNNIFRLQVMELMRDPKAKLGSNFEVAKVVVASIFPLIKYVLKVENIPLIPALFLKNILVKTKEQRESSNKRRNDIIDCILDQMNKNVEKEEVTYEDQFDEDAAFDTTSLGDDARQIDKERTIISSAFILFIAALDTTSSTLTFIIHFLMKYPDIQDNARREIMEVIGENEKPTFEHIQDLKYLDKLILETLRHVHPFGQILERVCTKDYQIPNTDYIVRKGEVVSFTFLYERMKTMKTSFYNACEFDPENFDASNNPNQFSFLGFGQGPRNCIGKRYAIISIKVALVGLLKKFHVVKTDNTKEDLKLFKFAAGCHVPFKAVPIDQD